MRWIMALLAILATVLVLMPLRWEKRHKHPRWWSLTLKVIPTLMCAAFAAAAAAGGGDRYSVLILIGLCVCAAADVVLGIHFVTGGALFFTGHMFYIAAFCTQQAPGWWSLPVFAVTLALLWLFLSRFRQRVTRPLLFKGAHLYSAALAVVIALSLPLPFLALSQRAVLAALGAVIFVLSDMGVCHGMFCKLSRKRDMFYLGIYYLAQLLLALSAF